MLGAYIKYLHHFFLPHNAIYFVRCTIPFCCKAALQHDAATPVLHDWDSVFMLASLPHFPPNITMLMGFGAMASFLLSGLTGYVHKELVLMWIYCGYLCTCFLKHIRKGLCCRSVIDLHFFTEVCSSIRDRRHLVALVVKQLYGPSAPYFCTIVCTVVLLGVWKLFPMDKPDL